MFPRGIRKVCLEDQRLGIGYRQSRGTVCLAEEVAWTKPEGEREQSHLELWKKFMVTGSRVEGANDCSRGNVKQGTPCPRE